jgi:Ca2+:H+ antiporter
VALGYTIRLTLRHYFKEPAPVNTLAKGRAIDLSIQFLLFWMPFFVLLAWWTGRPLTLLFGKLSHRAKLKRPEPG